MESVNQRVRYLRNILKMSTRQFGGEICYSNATISNVENARPPYENGVEDKLLIRISEHFKVNLLWLKTGEGEIFKREAPILNAGTPTEWALRLFRDLKPDDQQKILEIAQAIVEECEKKNLQFPETDARTRDFNFSDRRIGCSR